MRNFKHFDGPQVLRSRQLCWIWELKFWRAEIETRPWRFMAAFEEPAQSEGSAGEATISHAEGVGIGFWEGNMEEGYGG